MKVQIEITREGGRDYEYTQIERTGPDADLAAMVRSCVVRLADQCPKDAAMARMAEALVALGALS